MFLLVHFSSEVRRPTSDLIVADININIHVKMWLSFVKGRIQVAAVWWSMFTVEICH